jgi:hypothetical protein
MKKITPVQALKTSILALEIRQKEEGILLKEQLMITYESLKPVNLIKKTIKDLVEAPALKQDLAGAALSLAAGHISKKIIGDTHNPFKQILGSLLQMGISSIVSNNSDGIRSGIGQLINIVFNKKNTSGN